MQVIRLHSDIAVVHDQVLVSSAWDHLLEVTDFDVGPEYIWANYRLNIAVGKFALQLFHAGQCRIFRIADSENNFVLRIILQAMAAEALVDLGVDSLQRLKYG